MINFYDVTGEKRKNQNLNWLQILDCPYKISIIGGSGSRKTITLLNLINH